MFFIIKVIILMSFFTIFSYSNQIFYLFDGLYDFIQVRKRVWILLIVFIAMLLIDFKLGVMSIVLYFIQLSLQPIRSRKKNKRLIEFYGYKIFKFLMNQISSGILISDSIKSMYRVVDDAELKNCLIEVSAYYSRTSDISASLVILRKQYKGLEVDTLCLAIEQGIHTGSNYETLKKLEVLLFKRYINQIKLETGWQKRRSILSVLLLCTIMVLMISVPVMMDIMRAFNQIFLF